MKRLLLALVRFYRRNISPLKPPCCRYHLLDLNRSIADCESGDHTVVPAAVLPALRQGLADAHSIFGAEEELQLSPAEKAA